LVVPGSSGRRSLPVDDVGYGKGITRSCVIIPTYRRRERMRRALASRPVDAKSLLIPGVAWCLCGLRPLPAEGQVPPETDDGQGMQAR
jgi:hypothetical protein